LAQFTASDYIIDAATLYGDIAYDRVFETTWIKYLNASIRALILVRPDAGAQTDNLQLVAGVLQTLPATALRMLDITRNMGVDGLTAGKIITPVDRKHLDYSNLLWPVATGDTEIDNFSYNKENPRIFYVTPPVHATTAVYVELQVSQLPTAVTASGDDPGINDVFFEPIIQYMLYKAFSTDDEGVEFQKAITYMQNFFNLLQVEMATSNAAGPEAKE
jgi:hypothetical protein